MSSVIISNIFMVNAKARLFYTISSVLGVMFIVLSVLGDVFVFPACVLIGFYLAIRELGTCAFILSIKVYYKKCPATVIRHTQLPEVPATDGIETAFGQ